jgi:hypothetical protein
MVMRANFGRGTQGPVDQLLRMAAWPETSQALRLLRKRWGFTATVALTLGL